MEDEPKTVREAKVAELLEETRTELASSIDEAFSRALRRIENLSESSGPAMRRKLALYVELLDVVLATAETIRHSQEAIWESLVSRRALSRKPYLASLSRRLQAAPRLSVLPESS